jgi:protein-disulfide isomerase
VHSTVTVVIYGDYECSDCRRTHRLLLKSALHLFERVRYVYRHFPLFVHPHALRAAEAAEAAAAQGRFWEMHDLLFIHSDRLDDSDLTKYARKAGLDLSRFIAEMESQKYAAQILRERDRSLVHGITGTPTFYINNVLFAGSGEDVVKRVKSLLGE